jgi:hypothetical protein
MASPRASGVSFAEGDRFVSSGAQPGSHASASRLARSAAMLSVAGLGGGLAAVIAALGKVCIEAMSLHRGSPTLSTIAEPATVRRTEGPTGRER